MHDRFVRVTLYASVLILAVGQSCWAEVIYTVKDLGGGLFLYKFTLIDQGFINPITGLPEPVSGLNLLHAHSDFGLDETSTIGAPSGWDFFAPLPPLVDELNFFSLSPSADVPIGNSLEGFSFQSTVGVAVSIPTIFPCGHYDVIGSISNTQLSCVPEPASLILMVIGIGLVWYSTIRST